MKNLLFAVILSIMLVGTSFGQNVSAPASKPQRADNSTKPRIAVIEFKNSAALPYWEWEKFVEAQQKELSESFDVASRTATRAALGDELLSLNGPGMTATAVRVGKLLGVNYVLVGEVSESRPGVYDVKAKLVEVAVKVKGRPVIRIDFAEQSESPAASKPGRVDLIRPVSQKLVAAMKAAAL